jgi:hypothetical protein
MTVTANPDGTWTYEENTRLVLPDRAAPFDHIDRNTLHPVAPPTPNPLARAASAPATASPAEGSLAIGDLRSVSLGRTLKETA